jgi:hypothetical protein
MILNKGLKVSKNKISILIYINQSFNLLLNMIKIILQIVFEKNLYKIQRFNCSSKQITPDKINR